MAKGEIYGNGDEGITNVWIPTMQGDFVYRIYVENAFAIGPVVATSIYPSGGNWHNHPSLVQSALWPKHAPAACVLVLLAAETEVDVHVMG